MIAITHNAVGQYAFCVFRKFEVRIRPDSLNPPVYLPVAYGTCVTGVATNVSVFPVLVSNTLPVI